MRPAKLHPISATILNSIAWKTHSTVFHMKRHTQRERAPEEKSHRHCNRSFGLAISQADWFQQPLGFERISLHGFAVAFRFLFLSSTEYNYICFNFFFFVLIFCFIFVLEHNFQNRIRVGPCVDERHRRFSRTHNSQQPTAPIHGMSERSECECTAIEKIYSLFGIFYET